MRLISKIRKPIQNNNTMIYKYLISPLTFMIETITRNMEAHKMKRRKVDPSLSFFLYEPISHLLVRAITMIMIKAVIIDAIIRLFKFGSFDFAIFNMAKEPTAIVVVTV